MFWRNPSISLRAIGYIGILSVAIFFVSGRWFRAKVVDADVVSYYSYLPAAIVHGDMSMKYAVGNDFYGDKVWGVIWKEGSGPVQKYTMGLSWLYLPSFLLGHFSAYLTGQDAVGYGPTYDFWLQFSAIAYLLLGLWWMRKLLNHYFDEGISTWVLVILAFGTNLFYYTQGQAAMPHVYLFCLVSGLLWLSLRFWLAPSLPNALKVGLVCSMITLIRPNQLLFWLIPVMTGLSGKGSWKAWWLFWKAHWWRAAFWPLIMLLLILPQLFYWHALTDRWVYYSYGDEHFFWTDPKVWKVLFSYRNGWLSYTPIMILALIGLPMMWKRAKEFALVSPILLALAIYVISSWWCWWYGGSFGSRVFIDYYPLLALGLGSFLAFLKEKLARKGQRRLFWSFLSLFIVLNLFQTFQYTRGIIHYDSMTAEAYWKAFGRDRRPKNQEALLEHPDYEAAKKGIR